MDKVAPFRFDGTATKYSRVTFRSIANADPRQPFQRDGSTKTDPWIATRRNESRGSSEDPEDPHHTCGSTPSAFRFPAHFQPPRTVSFFSWPLNPRFLFDQRTDLSRSFSSTPTERDVAAINANREPIRSYFPLLPSCFTRMLTTSFQLHPRFRKPANLFSRWDRWIVG